MANNGGPAFPACNEANVNETMGMTLRDHFAGIALAAAEIRLFDESSLSEFDLKTVNEGRAMIAKAAYAYADAMLAERNRK